MSAWGVPIYSNELDLDPDSDEADDFAECLSRYDDDNDYGDS